MVIPQRSRDLPGQYREYDRYGQDWVIHVIKEPVQFTSASMQTHIYRVECPDANVGHVTGLPLPHRSTYALPVTTLTKSKGHT
jgi:hypothetical protein